MDSHGKVRAFNTSVYTQSDFALLPLDQLPIPRSVQLSAIDISLEDVFNEVSSLGSTRANGCDYM